jgi:methylglutamate dehydrogenase subunit D
MADTSLTPRSALSGMGGKSQPSGGVTVYERHGLGLATMLARRNQEAQLRERIKRHFLIDLPDGPALAHADKVAFIGIGPGNWLALSENGGHVFSTSLRQITAPLASVSDQGGGYAVFRVSGHAVRETLAKGFTVDLDARAFKPGDAATTLVSHIGATIWRREDNPDGTAVFEITVFRSLAQSFWEWLSGSAVEFGCELLQQPAPQ